MAQQLEAYSITAPGFYGLNTQDSSLDLASGFALTATNCVIDQYGRVGARKGWEAQHSSSGALGTNYITAIGEVVTADGTSYTVCAGNAKLFILSAGSLTQLTYGGGGVTPLLTDGNWSVASLNGKLYLFQEGYDPLVFDPDTSTTTYRRVSEMTSYSGTVQQSNVVIAAYGRLWNSTSDVDKVTIQWSDILSGNKWSGGSSGSLNTESVWPKGGDTIVGLGAHNGYLFIFGKNNILIYNNATDPSAMTLQDTVSGIGCVSRDSIAYTGTDILFLSTTGLRSIQRTIQEKSAPFSDLSKNVRNDLVGYVLGETDTTIKGVYSPKDAFYLLSLQTSNIAYCFDMKGKLQDGSSRVTVWENLVPRAAYTKADGTLLVGMAGYVGAYSGYTDNNDTYRMTYYTNHTDLGRPIVSIIPKKMIAYVVGGSDQDLIMKWAYDFTGAFDSQITTLPAQSVAYYGESEYNYGYEYSAGQVLNVLTAYPTGSGKVIQLGFETDVYGFAVSIQKLEIHAKEGKIY